MICYRCGMEAGNARHCPSCGADLEVFHRVIRISNSYYNIGLEQASVRNLSSAVISLKNSLKFNKYNIDARNLPHPAAPGSSEFHPDSGLQCCSPADSCG